MIANMVKHYVTFYSPGTFVAEETTKEIAAWDVDLAKKMASKISERYSAKPYAFVFSTRERGENDFNSKETKRSNTYFINCKVITLKEIERKADPNEKILLENMRCNKWNKVVQTKSGWKWTQPLDKNDVVLED